MLKIVFLSFLLSLGFAFENNEYFYDILKTNNEITIDGVLDEVIWKTGDPISNFTQKDPKPGEPSRHKTEVRVAIDDEFIYVGAYLYDSAPDSIAQQIIRRDGWGYSDWFAIGIDSYYDKRTCFGFHVSPSGSIRDMLYFNDTETDDSWDAVWESKSVIMNDGWSTEMKIPLSQLRFNPSKKEQIWGLNFYRKTARYGEESFWAPILMESKGFVSEFGILKGFVLPKQKKRIEILPYIASSDKLEPGSKQDPYWSKHNLSGNLGVDFKIGLGSNFTLTGTINPDFGQVEADPADLNLSAFETFFEERRPFFLEGTDIFKFGKTRAFSANSPSIFYSRRIGRNPRGSILDNSEYENYPSQTNIISALKFSGKTSNGLSIGILDALTAEEDALYFDSTETENSQPIEPYANSLVLRLKQDLKEGKVTFGGFLTNRRQALETNYLSSTFLSKSEVVGADFEFALPDPSWVVSGYTARSNISGANEVITDIQTNSTHYFQRPDDDIEIDSTMTNLEGTSSEISLTKISGKNLKGSLSYRQISPGYDINELGYMRSANSKQLKSYIEYQDFVPKKYWQLFSFSFGTWNDRDYKWENGNNGFWADFWIRLNNWYSVSMDFEKSGGGKNRTLTRGGPIAGLPTSNKYGLRIRTDRRKSVNTYVRIGNRFAEDGEYDKSFRTGINYRPNSQWKIELDIFMNKEFDTDQFVESISDELAVNTYKTRYIFSDISNDSKGFSFETNMISSPQLSIQFFLRPEISHYRYEGLKEFLEPGKFNFSYYEEDQIIEIDDETIEIDPDRIGLAPSFQLSSDYTKGFNFLSLRSNFIIKWEYNPGSALFLVWQQQRDHYEVTDSRLKLDKGFGQLMKSDAINTIMFKIAYWISS